ncbi:MAG: RNA-dependent DNA polymerase [Deltaproteobacteria bacterium]|nr:RNA-dependent DNA polymerase [Deltaproteobacteria bacterium]
MHTVHRLFERVTSLENLAAAWREARRGKRFRPAAAAFELGLGLELVTLSEELSAETWTPGPYRILRLFEPKRRLIAAAPFRDRVVHHALCRHLIPPLSRSFVHHSYACRPGKGTHRAVLRHLELTRRWRFRCHLDVRAFFASVDIDLLSAVVARTVRDRRALGLLSRILEHGLSVYTDSKALAWLGLPFRARRGLPIGNLTSQHLANVFLDGVDHHLERVVKVPGYLRYMDDLTLFGNDRVGLEAAARATAEYLASARRLELKHEPKVQSTGRPVTYLGWRVSREGARLDPGTLERIGRRARALRSHPEVRVERALASWMGLRL